MTLSATEEAPAGGTYDFQRDVPDRKPDLVTIEFVNDAYLDEEADDLQAGGTGVCVRSLIRMILDHPFTTQGDDR